MKPLKCFILIGIMSLGLAPCAFPEVKIEGEAYYWFTDLTAKTKVVAEIIGGTEIDFKDDLGVKDENFPVARVLMNITPSHQIRLGYTQVNYTGERDITRSIVYDGRTYTAGVRVDSNFDIKYARVGLIWHMFNLADGMLKLGPVLELKGFTIDTALEASSLGYADSRNFIGGLPTVGVNCNVSPHKALNIFADVTGMYAGDYGHFIDAEVGVKIIPIKNVSIFGGYRFIQVKIEYDSDFAEFDIVGPYVGASVRF